MLILTRYEITFKDKKKPVQGEYIEAVASLNVFQNNTSGMLTIKNPSQLDITLIQFV